jgi:serine/threonine protein kinase
MPFQWNIAQILSLIGFSPPLQQDSLDISQSVVLVGNHYVAIGEHADLWIGDMSNKKVAVKVLRGGSSSNPDFLQKFKQRLEREALVWQRLRHPNVSEFYGLAFSFGYMPALILQFYSQGNVVEFCKGKKGEDKLDMVRQIAGGLEYLHANGVIHGDLRGANVLVDHNDRPRICDYGLAFIIEPSEFTSIKTAGACRWTAPEIMNPAENAQLVNPTDPIRKQSALGTFLEGWTAPGTSPPGNAQIVNSPDPVPLFTKQSDIYAFGMTFFEIFNENIPFDQKKNDSSVIFYVLDGGRPGLPPYLASRESLRQLVQSCWASEPGRRPTSRAIHEILEAHITPENCSTSTIEISDTGWFRSWL